MLVAYRATDGKQLWQFDVGTGIMAPAVTYTVNGVQYVTVMAGWGGGAGLFNARGSGPVKPGYGRILTFAIGGQAKLKVLPFGPQGPPPMPPLTYDSSPELVHRGAQIFNSRCMLCHGINAVGGSLPDLRYSSKEMIESLDQVLLDGVFAPAGMPSYKKILNAQDVKALQAYIVARARVSDCFTEQNETITVRRGKVVRSSHRWWGMVSAAGFGHSLDPNPSISRLCRSYRYALTNGHPEVILD